MADQKQATDFIKAKCQELADYMVTQGYGYEVTGSVLVGIGAGWVARERGVEVAKESLKMAELGITAAGNTLQ